MFIKTLSVSEVNNYIKKTIDNDFILSNIRIKGELSNLKIHSSGHIYFSLKDPKGKINSIMFRRYAEELEFIPEDGMKVVVKGRVSVYEKEGAYQLYCEEMIQEGMGQLYMQFLKLKQKLQLEGLFDENHKLDLPEHPKKIGVITSPTGAAIRDIINVTKRRNSNMNLLIYPSLMQGENAANNIIEGIKELNKIKDIDVIIIARGGGAIEELQPFNDESLARAIYDSKKPIVTGVGHEIDFTIVDFVSDRRAPTPSAAAEIVVSRAQDDIEKVVYLKEKLNREIEDYLKNEYLRLNMVNKSLNMYNPEKVIVNEYNRIDILKKSLLKSINSRVSIEKEKLAKQYSLLSAYNPLNILNKGYTIIKDDDDNIISSVSKIHDTKTANIIFKDGNAKVDIKVLEASDE